MNNLIGLRAVGFACLLATLVGVAQGHAQPPSAPLGPAQIRPAYSPYLNLTRGGATAAQNYYGLVRPEIDARRAIAGLEQQVTNNRLGLAQLTDPQTGFPVTGHTAVFLNTGGYFMNLSGGVGATPGTGGRGPAGTGSVAAFQSIGMQGQTRGVPPPRR